MMFSLHVVFILKLFSLLFFRHNNNEERSIKLKSLCMLNGGKC